MAITVILVSIFATCFAQNTTVLDVLKARRETTLLSLIDAAGLTDTLKTGGPFTIFAPSNYAFMSLGSDTLASLKADPVALANILKYHVVSGEVMKSDLMINEKMLDSLAGPKIRVNYYLYNKHSAVEGVRVTGFDYKADNGVVHMIQGVMLPPNGTLLELAANDPDFSTLKAAVDATGLDSVLQGDRWSKLDCMKIMDLRWLPGRPMTSFQHYNDVKMTSFKCCNDVMCMLGSRHGSNILSNGTSIIKDGPYTVFAPNNAAFQKLGDDLVQKLLANPDLLKSILMYHVVHGSLYSTGMHSGSLMNLEEVDRERLYASFSGRTVHVDSANVIDKDISATNGVVHVVDHVLIPSSLGAQIKAL